jgi:hypothetical protein
MPYCNQGFNTVSYFFPVVISKSPNKAKLEIVKHGAATKVEQLSLRVHPQQQH